MVKGPAYSYVAKVQESRRKQVNNTCKEWRKYYSQQSAYLIALTAVICCYKLTHTIHKHIHTGHIQLLLSNKCAGPNNTSWTVKVKRTDLTDKIHSGNKNVNFFMMAGWSGTYTENSFIAKVIMNFYLFSGWCHNLYVIDNMVLFFVNRFNCKSCLQSKCGAKH